MENIELNRKESRYDNYLTGNGLVVIERSDREHKAIAKRMFGLRKAMEEKEREDEIRRQKFLASTVLCECKGMRLHINECCMICDRRRK